MRRGRRLQSRLLLWFLGAIVLAIAASSVTVALTASDAGENPTRVISRHVLHRLAKDWDDPIATDAYIQQLRETTGLDLRVRRDPRVLGGRRGGVIFEEGVAYAPIVRGGQVVGALELHTGASPPRPWRVGVALGVALLVLGGAARRVSKRLARPLEQLAGAAEKFGSGDLTARTGIDRLPERWVAEEVKDVGRAFDGMADRIEKVVVEQRELLGAISHELRSPLGRARVALEIARERVEADPSATRNLDDVDRQLVEVDAILGDLLASARAGLGDLRLEPVAVGPWLTERVAAEGTKVELALAPDASSQKVAVDPRLLGRALHNVLANALAHGHPAGAPLTVALTHGDGRARIAVRDRGPGFAADVLPRAFEPFVTGRDRARSPGQGGMGLGLALVRRIVEAHGGTVSARNVDGGGAEVAFDLPLA
jgi:signal transduction histidine kinase